MTTRSLLLPGTLAALCALSACPAPVAPDPEVPASATVSAFTASPQQVQPGETATLSWEVADATRVTLATSEGTAVELADPAAASGEVEVQVDASTVFILTATGPGGSSTAATSVAVTEPAGEILFTSSPEQITAGQSATLLWNASGAGQVTITDAEGTELYTGSQSAGSLQVSPTVTTTYTLTADSGSRSATVDVTPAILAFQATPATGARGEPVTLSWKVGGAEQVKLSAEGRGELITVTDTAQIADGSFTDTTPATLPDFGSVTYRLEASRGTRVVVETLTVYSDANPRITAEIPASAAEGGAFVVSWVTEHADQLVISVDGTPIRVAASAAEVQSGTLTLPSPAPGASQQVSLRAWNLQGGEVVESATVEGIGAPVFNTFTATPPVVAAGGDPVTLSWDVTNGRHVKVYIKDSYTLTEVTGAAAATGSITVYPNMQTEYILEADNTVGGSIAPQSASVTVTAPASFTFTPAQVPAGASVTATSHNVPNGGDVKFFIDGFEDISTTGTAYGYSPDFDVTAVLINLGQNFQMTAFGQTVGGSTVSVANNGWFFFNGSAVNGPDGPGVSAPLPSTALEPFAFAPFFADLYSGDNGEIYWQLDGSGSSQRLIIQYEDWELHSDSSSVITFQAQLYSSGKVVFAYETLDGLTATEPLSVGVVNGDETGGEIVTTRPEAGDVVVLFDTGTVFAPLPQTFRVPFRPFVGRVQIGNDNWIDIEVDNLILPPDLFSISEVHYNPATGKEEWFEVVNNSSTPIDLQTWEIDFGNGNPHTISTPLILPANGTLLFGQSADSAEASQGGAAVDYVYGTGFSMPDAAGSVALARSGGAYASLAWTSPGTQGASLFVDASPDPALLLASGVTELRCAALAPYGSGVQFGTPGAPNGSCFPYTLTPITGAFQAIAATGTVVPGMDGSSNADGAYEPVTFPVPLRIFGQAVSTLDVSANGFVALETLTESWHGNNATPDTDAPNGTIAPFWDDLDENSTGGVYWQQFDPDATAGTGDEYTLVSWEDWKRWNQTSSLNFQIKFLHASGDIEFHYGSMTSTTASYSNGADATSWIENLAGTAALAANVNSSTTPGIQPNSGFRFAFTP